MSIPNLAEPVKVIVSLFASSGELLNTVLCLLAERFGRPDVISTIRAFSQTEYYAGEMGDALLRRFAAFADLVPPDLLPEIKIWTNALEERFTVSGRRQVNVDPGYLSKAHLILATGKAYAHRPYLRKGVYADLTLLYRRQNFETLPWTYPDYAEPGLREFFGRIRRKYLLQVHHEEIIRRTMGGQG